MRKERTEAFLIGLALGESLTLNIMRTLGFLFLILFPLGISSGGAHADFRICNRTSARIGLAIGVKEGPIFITQGWYNMKPNACDNPIKDDLKAGPYYIYGVDYDRGGEWSGPQLLCIGDHEFYVEGSADCYARGYERAGFRRIETKGQRNWTLDITDETSTTGLSVTPVSPPPPFDTLTPGQPVRGGAPPAPG